MCVSPSRAPATNTGVIERRLSGDAARRRRYIETNMPTQSTWTSHSRMRISSSRKAGWLSTANSAFGGQSVEQVAHSVLGGNASTSGAVPKKSRTRTASIPPKTTRSSPRAIRPSGYASSR
jgi:hypothetical protein